MFAGIGSAIAVTILPAFRAHVAVFAFVVAIAVLAGVQIADAAAEITAESLAVCTTASSVQTLRAFTTQSKPTSK